ncbi:MAG: cytochrome C, partial [Acidobacteriota bacterium]
MPRKWSLPLVRVFATNWITIFGANITTISAIAIIAFLVMGLLGLVDSPYIALMSLMVLPGVFVAGLLLIPVGLLWERRKKRSPEYEEVDEREYPVIDLNTVKARRITVGVITLTVINILIISIVSYEGVAYMESTEFCGQVCHSVMDPEYTAYIRSPHS